MQPSYSRPSQVRRRSPSSPDSSSHLPALHQYGHQRAVIGECRSARHDHAAGGQGQIPGAAYPWQPRLVLAGSVTRKKSKNHRDENQGRGKDHKAHRKDTCTPTTPMQPTWDPSKSRCRRRSGSVPRSLLRRQAVAHARAPPICGWWRGSHADHDDMRTSPGRRKSGRCSVQYENTTNIVMP